LIEASVWITSSMRVPAIDSISRPSALITPVVSVESRPNGLPIASTFWPTSSWCESASFTGCSGALAAMRSTARSLRGSTPTSAAS
jgi:hypothetical protein